MFAKLISLLDEFSDVSRQMRVIGVVVIAFWDKKFVCINYCFDDVVICFVYVCGVG